MTNAVSIAQLGANNSSFTNRIINGQMVLDQRNAGASVTPSNGQYLADRFQYQTSQASKFSYQRISTITSMPAGFNNYSRFTVATTATVGASDYFAFLQGVEGYNIADLNWGTANASSVNLSFWVRSSVAGTFGGSVQGISGNYRSYVFSYTVSVANTWTQITVAIPGDTSAPSGGWGTTNNLGLYVWFGLSVGSTFAGSAGSWSSNNFLSVTGNTALVTTLGATFDITGVQLEKGSTATSFDYRPYGTELALCQRYYWKATGLSAGYGVDGLYAAAGGNGLTISWGHPITMRAAPTATADYNDLTNCTVSLSTTATGFRVILTSTSSGRTGAAFTATGFVSMSAEL
jgi:hypothetical protein